MPASPPSLGAASRRGSSIDGNWWTPRGVHVNELQPPTPHHFAGTRRIAADYKANPRRSTMIGKNLIAAMLGLAIVASTPTLAQKIGKHGGQTAIVAGHHDAELVIEPKRLVLD